MLLQGGFIDDKHTLHEEERHDGKEFCLPDLLTENYAVN